jgi:hypothetical protein
MRLIDADKLKEAINSSLNTGRETFSPEIIYEAVDEQPTAFDLDKVVEQLDTYITKLVGRNAALYQTVMQIVKGGGIK